MPKLMKNFMIINFVFAVFLSAMTGEGMLTPYSDNILLAKINGEIINEYDVFGFPADARDRKVISSEQRHGVIENYIFDKILQEEGNIPSVLNTEEYKKSFDALNSKNAVEFLKEYLINKQFTTKAMVNSYYKSNKSKFSGNSTDKEKELIISALKKEKEKEIKIFLRNYMDKLKLSHKVKYNDDLFKTISEIKAKTTDEFAEQIKSLNLNQELVYFENQKVFLNQLHSQIKQIKPYHISNLSNVDVLKSMVDGQILNSILSLNAKKEGFLKNETVVKKTKDQLKHFVAKKYKEIITSNDKFIPTKDEMIDYYISHKDDNELKSKRKMWVFEIFKEYNNKDSIEDNDNIKVAIDLENVRQKILKGESFEKYAKFYPRPHTKDGELGFIFETDHALVGKTAATMKEGDVSDLIIQEKAISVIKVTKVQEPMLYKFEYVEEIIKLKLIEMKRDLYMEKYKNELFNKYKVEFLSYNLKESK